MAQESEMLGKDTPPWQAPRPVALTRQFAFLCQPLKGAASFPPGVAEKLARRHRYALRFSASRIENPARAEPTLLLSTDPSLGR